MKNTWFRVAAFFMMVGVVLGAFGAHALKSRISPANLEIYHTAVLYNFIHAFGLFMVGVMTEKLPRRMLAFAGFSFIFGIIFFSGSLYILALTGIRWIGAFTPIGGLLFILGWGLMAFGL